MRQTIIQCAERELNIDSPVVMGILNVTPDSFSDGGRFNNRGNALRQAEKMCSDGAKIIDVGGESTRPGAASVSVSEELDRVIPIIEKIHQELDVIISIDTSKAKVMTAAAQAGVGMINDVMALANEGSLNAAKQTGLPVCLMHIQGKPRSMQSNPVYDDVLVQVKDFLQQRIVECVAIGIKKQNIIIDPGFGFGKTLAHNIALFKHLNTFIELNHPVLVGVSRKSMIGLVTGKEIEHRMAGSLAMATLAATKGAAILRVHDVAETVDAIKIANTYS